MTDKNKLTKRQRIWYWLGYHGLFQINWWWRKNYHRILGVKEEVNTIL